MSTTGTLPAIAGSDGKPDSQSSSPWVYRPWLDLLIGCGAWTLPLLLLAYPLMNRQSTMIAVCFYALALIFNYPHFMATIYRAYHSQQEFSKYRFFTVHVTAIILLTVIAAHWSQRMLPWLFTAYITWSPWHYSGQNFGIFMMFARRNGRQFTRDQRGALFFSFLCSYLMLIVIFQSGASTDPFLLSLNLSTRFITAAEVVLLICFFGLAAFAIGGNMAKQGWRGMLPSCVVLSSQFLWFVLPTILQLAFGWRAPQSAYAGGVLAIMHSAQYLWVTTYYAQREAAEQKNVRWRSWKYFAVLVAGGVALFIPGPWLVSYAFHYDFTVTFIIFTALVNIHHFILDGAIWKLRDNRIAKLLLNTPEKSGRAPAQEEQGKLWSWMKGDSARARNMRVTVTVALIAFGIMEVSRYALSSDAGNLSHLKLASVLNPYDSALQRRLGQAYAKAGNMMGASDVARRLNLLRPQFQAEEKPKQALSAAAQHYQNYQQALEKYNALLRQTKASEGSLLFYQDAVRQAINNGNLREQGRAWLGYAKFLEHRPEVSPRYRLACVLKAEKLLMPLSDPRAQSAIDMQLPLEKLLGGQAGEVHRQMEQIASSALNIK